MSHWKGFKEKKHEQIHVPHHHIQMTPDICGPRPLGFHDNMADAQEKTQMYRIRSKASSDGMGNGKRGGSEVRTAQGPRTGGRHGEGPPLGTELPHPPTLHPHTIRNPLILVNMFQGKNCCIKGDIRFWAMGHQPGTHRN